MFLLLGGALCSARLAMVTANPTPKFLIQRSRAEVRSKFGSVFARYQLLQAAPSQFESQATTAIEARASAPYGLAGFAIGIFFLVSVLVLSVVANLGYFSLVYVQAIAMCYSSISTADRNTSAFLFGLSSTFLAPLDLSYQLGQLQRSNSFLLLPFDSDILLRYNTTLLVQVWAALAIVASCVVLRLLQFQQEWLTNFERVLRSLLVLTAGSFYVSFLSLTSVLPEYYNEEDVGVAVFIILLDIAVVALYAKFVCFSWKNAVEAMVQAGCGLAIGLIQGSSRLKWGVLVIPIFYSYVALNYYFVNRLRKIRKQLAIEAALPVLILLFVFYQADTSLIVCLTLLQVFLSLGLKVYCFCNRERLQLVDLEEMRYQLAQQYVFRKEDCNYTKKWYERFLRQARGDEAAFNNQSEHNNSEHSQ